MAKEKKYKSVRQMVEVDKMSGKGKKVYPVTPIQAVYDARTGASLEAILAQFNNVFLQYQGSAAATRCLLPMELRRVGITISYRTLADALVTERCMNDVQRDNEYWGLDVNWARVDGQVVLSGELSVSEHGTWVVNGEDTGIVAQGAKGDNGLTPWLKFENNKLYGSYDKVKWDELSGLLATELRIKGYVSSYSALPSSAIQGDIWGVGPTNADTNPTYRYYVRNAGGWVDNGEFTSIAAGIVQETGDGEGVVMSQKAVSGKLAELGSEMSKSLMKGYVILKNQVVSIDEGVNYGTLIDSDKFDSILMAVGEDTSSIEISGAIFKTFAWFSNYEFVNSCFLGYNRSGIKKEGSKFVLISLPHSGNNREYTDLNIKLKINLYPNISDRQAIIIYNKVQSISNAGDSSVYSYSNNELYDVLLVSLLVDVSDVKVSGITTNSKWFSYSNSEPSASSLIGYGEIKNGARCVGINIKKSDNPNADYNKITIEQVIKYVPSDRFNNLFKDKIIEKPLGKNFIDKDNLFEGHIISGGNIIDRETAALSNKMYLEKGKHYSVQGVVAYGTVPTIYFATFNSNDEFIDRFSIETIVDEELGTSDEKVGHGTFVFDKECHYVRVAVKNRGTTNPAIAQLEEGSIITDYEPYKGSKEVFNTPTERKQLKVLSIGNSYSQDALSYVPYIMEGIYNNVDITVGILYLSGAKLNQHYDNFVNESASYKYYKKSPNESAWTIISSNETIQAALMDEKWDIILLQQGSIASFDWSTYQPYLNNLINLIYNSIDYPVKFGWMQTMSRPKNGEIIYSDDEILSHYKSITENSKRVIDETVCDFLLPVGTAIENARGTTLNSIGYYGKLCASDGGHLQEGLPCQLAAYVCVLKFAELLGYSYKSVFGDTTRVTEKWVSGKDIPGPNGTPIGSNDYNCSIAQKCAIMAVKNPYMIKKVANLGDYIKSDIQDGILHNEYFVKINGEIVSNASMKYKEYNLSGDGADFILSNFKLPSGYSGVPIWCIKNEDDDVIDVDISHAGPVDIDNILIRTKSGAKKLLVNAHAEGTIDLYSAKYHTINSSERDRFLEEGKHKLYIYEDLTSSKGNANAFYIRTKFDKERDILIKYWINKNGLISPFSTSIGSKLLADEELIESNVVSSHKDSTAPLFNSSVYWHLFAQHGYVIPVINNKVGMTTEDVGAIWKDQLDREYAIGNVTDSEIYLLPVIFKDSKGNDTRRWKTPQSPAITNMNHISGGGYRDSFVVDGVSTTQLHPIMKSFNRKMLIDGKEVSKAGIYYFDEFKVSESQIGYDPASVVTWFPTPILDNAREMIRLSWSYNFKGANCCVNTTIDIRTRVECQSYGATQQQTFFDTGNYKAMFMIPKAASRNGVELDKPFNSPTTSSPTYSFYRTSEYLKDVDDPIDRLIGFLHNPNDNTYLFGMAAGLSLVSGDTVKEKRIADMPLGSDNGHYRVGSLSPSNTNKFYVAAINTAPYEEDNYHFPTTLFKEINYYVSYFDPSENVGQVYWYKDGSKYVIYMHCQTEQNKLAINLPEFMEGLKVEIVEKTEGAKLLTDVIQNGKLYANYNDEANYIVIKTV